MSIDIEDQVVTQQVAHLDFHPKCTAVTIYRAFGINFWATRCLRPARWMTVYPGCGEAELACDRCRHKWGEWYCCGRTYPEDFLEWELI